jgi:2-dehydro-3-deoxygluconokinase
MADKRVTFMSDVTVLSELLLRFDPPGFQRLVQADHFGLSFTGAEANVAVNLAQFGVDSAIVSKVPEHEIGQAMINNVRRFGVDTTHIARGGERLGILYVETGAAQRSTNVVYDRKHSSFESLLPGELDWDRILARNRWFFFSGSGLSRGPNVVAVTQEACIAAKRLGVKVGCDINYRSKLWSLDEASTAFSGLMQYVDLAMTSLGDAKQMFKLTIADDDPYGDAAKQLHERYGCELVALGVRDGDTSSSQSYGALMYDGCELRRSRTYDIDVVDRIGTGDALTSGILYGLMADWAPQRTIDFGAAAACLKHTIPLDFNLVSVAEVEDLVATGVAGRVKR